LQDLFAFVSAEATESEIGPTTAAAFTGNFFITFSLCLYQKFQT